MLPPYPGIHICIKVATKPCKRICWYKKQAYGIYDSKVAPSTVGQHLQLQQISVVNPKIKYAHTATREDKLP